VNQGFYTDIPAADYHADKLADIPSLSSSLTKTILQQSLLKAWHEHPRLNPNYRAENDSKFDLGTVAHAVLLQQDEERIQLIDPQDYPGKKGGIPDGWTNDAIRAARDAAYAAGKTPLFKHHYDTVLEMVGAARKFLSDCEITEYWNEGESEVTCLWKEGSIWLRSRIDRLAKNKRCIMDYKSTVDASPDVFSRQIVRMGYHIQDSFYRRGLRAQGYREVPFVFLVQSCEPPYECHLNGCDPALQEIADAEVDRAVQMWRTALLTDKWSSYGKRIHWTMPTSYQIQEHEMRVMEEAA
jgi:hypothetical protein